MTPLHAAAMNGRTEAVAYLLGLGAGHSAPAEYGYTPLHMAARHGQLETAKQLISAGANINATTVHLVGGSVPVLLEALKRHDLEMIALLDKLGADPVKRNSHHVELATARRLALFARWTNAASKMDKGLASDVAEELAAHPPLWTTDLGQPGTEGRKLRTFKMGDGYHHRISVILVLTNLNDQVLDWVSFATTPFSMDYTNAHIEPDIKKAEDGTTITLRFVKASVKDWSLKVRMSGNELIRLQDPPLEL